MATKDFRASQVETSKIIASGSLGSTTATNLGIAIYSGSVASNREGGTTDNAMLADVGTDVFLFVSGAKTNGPSTMHRTNVSLFGGDVVISGTLYSERQVVEVDSVADGNFIVTGSMFVEPDVDSVKSVTFRKANGTDIFNIDSTNSHVEMTGRVGINDDGPDAILDVVGASDAGCATLRVDHNEDTLDAVFVNAPNLTSGEAVSISDSSSSTTARSTLKVNQSNAAAVGATGILLNSYGGKKAIDIDKNFYNLSSADVYGINIDLDKFSTTTTDNNIYGVNVVMDNSTATNGENTMTGFSVTPTLTHAADAGKSTIKGINIVATGGTNGDSSAIGADITATGTDANVGLVLSCSDGGTDLKIVSTADDGDYFTLQVGAAGETTLTTIDDDATAANLLLNIDGDIRATPAGGNVYLNDGASDIFEFDTADAIFKIYDDADTGAPRDFAQISVAVNGQTTISTNDDNATNATLTLDADGDIKIEAATGKSVIINDGSADVDFRIESNEKSAAMLVDGATNQIAFLSRAATSAADAYTDTQVSSAAAIPDDIGLFISGAIGGRGVTTGDGSKGTTVIGGDAHLSGAIGISKLTTAPPNPLSNEVVLYGLDDGGGTTKLFYKTGGGTQVGPLGSGGSLDDAYDTPNGGGTKATGAGAIVTVDGQPVQFQSSGQALSVTGSSVFNETGGAFDFRVESDNNQYMLMVKGSTDRVGIGTVSAPQKTLHLQEATPTFRIQRTNDANPIEIEFTVDGGTVTNSIKQLGGSLNDLVLNAWNGSEIEESIRLKERRIILLSGSGVDPDSMQPLQTTDINFFVSGAVDSRNTNVKGTAVFGGDVIISGAMRSTRQLFKQQLEYVLSVNSSDPRFPSLGAVGATTTPDVENYWVAAGSGSLRAVDVWVSEPSTARASLALFVNDRLTPKCHITGSFINHSILGASRGHLRIDFDNPNLGSFLTGSNRWNPGDLISVTIAKESGSTFTNVFSTVYYDMDTVDINSNIPGGGPD